MKNHKNSSLLVILISAAQLIVMLLVVGFMYQYSQDQLSVQGKRNVFENNVALIAHCRKAFREFDGRSVALEKGFRAKANECLADLEAPNGRFYVMLDPRTCEIYAMTNQKVVNDALQNDICRAEVVSESGETTTLGQFVMRSNGNADSGTINLAGESYFFSGSPLPEIDAYALICQDQDVALAHVSPLLYPLKKTAFGISLLVGLVGFCISVVILRRYETHLGEINQSLEEKVVARTTDLLTTQKAVIYGLAKLAESRDNDTGDHLARIQLYVTILAQSLMKYHPEIDEDYIRNLSLASSLHDIGKVGVPDAILLKQGRLTPAERSIMELHTVIGGDCLSSIQSQLGENDFLEMARQIAYYHHERWDGTGYPRGRSEEETPLCARIVSVADVYDALRTKRPYKQPLPHAKSRDIILSGIGTQFDPEVVAAFLENEDEFERISEECSKMTAEEVTPKIKILTEMITSK